MLKITFCLLLLINGGLLAFQQGYLDEMFPSTREPVRMKQQLNADKLILIPSVESKPAVTPAAAPAAEHTAAQATNASAVAACTEIGIFDEADAKRFEAQLAGLSLGDRVTRRLSSTESARHIVYIPPLGGKEAADRKAVELKRLGIEDFFVIQDSSPLQWGISLGIFKSEEAARNQLAILTQKGVRSARVGTHGPTTNKVAFQLRGLDAATQTKLQKIRESFPRQDVHDCS